MVGIQDLKGWLQGAWHIERALENKALNQRGKMSGILGVVENDSRLWFSEKLSVYLGEYVGQATSKIFAVFSQPHQADLYFDHGDFFHFLDLSQGVALVQHFCGDDVYEGCYEVLTPDHFKIDWLIQGPRKHQEIKGHYRRKQDFIKQS